MRTSGTAVMTRVNPQGNANAGGPVGPGGAGQGSEKPKARPTPAPGNSVPPSTRRPTPKIPLPAVNVGGAGSASAPKKSPTPVAVPAVRPNQSGRSSDPALRAVPAAPASSSSARRPALTDNKSTRILPPGAGATASNAARPGSGALKPAMTSIRLPIPPAAANATGIETKSARSAPLNSSQTIVLPRWVLWGAGLACFMAAAIVLFFVLRAPKVPGTGKLSVDEKEAIDHLHTGPKDDRDLRLIQSRLLKATTIEDVNALLGEPDLKFDGKMALWDPTRGSYTESAAHLYAYYLQSSVEMTPDDPHVGVLLFSVEASGALAYRGPKIFDRNPMPDNLPDPSKPVK